MKLEHESTEVIKRRVLEILGRHLDLDDYRVFFFGSRVSGSSRKASDIDLGIEGKRPVPAGVLSRIREEIEQLPFLYKIEVVDFADVGDKFKSVAKQHIELVN